MRPGQTAPECGVRQPCLLNGLSPASMRPGQTAPECSALSFSLQAKAAGFNEAGADCPGMPGGAGIPIIPARRLQ